MTDITVKIEPGSGVATIELRGAAIVEPRFRLRDTATEKFLTKRGWSKAPAFLPGEAVTEGDLTTLALDAELARRIVAGTSLSLEQPASNVFASLTWPNATVIGAVDPEPEKPEEGDAAHDGPTSLEPAIREEAILPFHAPEVVGSKVDADEEPSDDDAPGRSWGFVAAVAMLFLVLGSLLTYFWQSSAYDSDLRTAMRALEAQRDEEKATFEKRLAEAAATADNSSTDTIATTNTQVASLTDQTAQLARDRDTARKALADQQSAVKDLEQRLATATAEVETLKTAQEADATEQSAVFNERITTLTAELDTARKDLVKARSDLSQKDQSLAKSDTDLKAARTEIAALRKAATDAQDAGNQALDTKVKSLGAELDKAAQNLADRDKALRDVQAKLSVANVQIEALKQVAGKATESDLERSTLADQLTELTTKLDKADKDLAAREQELAKAKTSLDAANALLSSNADEIKRLTEAKAAGPAENPEPGEQPAGLQQERDLYAKELSTMTESFSALKAEKDKLAETVKTLEEQVASAGTNTATDGGSRAIWGATAIDRAGAIYSLQNQIAEKSATENVLALCRGKSQAGCEALKTYSNSCFSVARIEGEGPRNDNFGYSVNKDWKAAESGAVRQCQELGADCTVRFTACSPDVLSKPLANQ